MASTFRRSVNYLVPLATKLACGQRCYCSVINKSRVTRTPFFSHLVPNPRYYAKLYKDIPVYYPYKLEDEPDCPTLSFTRTYGLDKRIELKFHKPHLVSDEGEADDGNEMFIPVNVILYDDPVTFEHICKVYPNKIVIEGLVVVVYFRKEPEIYMGLDFLKLQESYRKSLYERLAQWGIRPCLIKSLHEYVIDKYKTLV